MLYSRLPGWLSMVRSWSGRRFCLPKQSISLVLRPGDLPPWCRNSKMSWLLNLGNISGNLPTREPSESTPRLFLSCCRGWFHVPSCGSLYACSPGSCQQNTGTKWPLGGFHPCCLSSSPNTCWMLPPVSMSHLDCKGHQEGLSILIKLSLNLRHSMLPVITGPSKSPGLLSCHLVWSLTKGSRLKEDIFQLPDSTVASARL